MSVMIFNGVVIVMVLVSTAAAASMAYVTQVAGPAAKEQQQVAESKTFGGFMEDIGFQNFFQDVGIESAASAPSYTQVLPAASNQFGTLGSFQFSGLGPLGEQTKEQIAAQKEQGFMPTNPFGSPSNLESSNIAPPASFKNSHNFLGSSSNTFQFPKAFHDEFSAFSGGFGGRDEKDDRQAVKEQPRRESAGSRNQVDHRPRGQAASNFQPRFAQRRHDFSDDNPFGRSSLYASPSKKEETKKKGKCEIVNKDGMTCEVCNDGHGGFSEHCSHSQNSGKDSKFTNTRRHTSDDHLKPKDGQQTAAPAPVEHQKSQQRQVSQRQRPNQGGARPHNPANDHSVFDFDIPSFGSSPYAQSRQDKVYNTKDDPFGALESEPYDPFAEGSNSDPYKFEIPKFEDIDFDFGPEDHKKLVAESGLHEDKKKSAASDSPPAPAPSARSASKQNKVADQNPKNHPISNPQDNYKQLGKMVVQFGKKNRSNCKKEVRKTMTCYICPNQHGKTDEECMYASKDPHSQHMMYTEESSYGNPK